MDFDQTWYILQTWFSSTFQFSNFRFSASNSVFSVFANPEFFSLFYGLFRRIVYKPTSDWSIDRTIDWFSEIIIASVGLYKIGRGYQFIKKEWSIPSRVVERDSNKNLEIDKGIRNWWKWEWLERFVDGNPVRQTIQKIDSRGLARCEVCNKEINYAGRGWKSLETTSQKETSYRQS
jgi:hypothetical protein